mmetsp:Transcript_4/g.18  ORF Transcript_4/g.18 Transcript_4/m.18 type:complete len:84 (+) Transcript_4:747-998(+)
MRSFLVCVLTVLLPVIPTYRRSGFAIQARGQGILAIKGGSQETGWTIRVYSLRMLQHQLPELLVESGQVSWSCRFVTGLSLDH